jgi:uncharacterized protein YcbK (DUF882 family)
MIVTQVTKNFKITEHFTIGEMCCKCGCNTIPNDIFDNLKKLCVQLELLRAEIGRPITVISQYRCVARNKKIGGAPKSRHISGRAADIVVEGMSPEEVAKAADKLFRGIGIYSSFTHLDIRKSVFKARWKK